MQSVVVADGDLHHGLLLLLRRQIVLKGMRMELLHLTLRPTHAARISTITRVKT